MGYIMKKLVVATKNKGKIVELKRLLEGMNYEVLSMQDAGIDIDVVEDGTTFEENALKKAQEIAKISKTIVLSDDSGIEVDYLNGEPGIYSARFGGPELDDEGRNQLLLTKLAGVPDEKRTARYVCAIAVVFTDGSNVIIRDTCEGVINHKGVGDKGFGYDPLFYLPEYGKTMAQLDMDIKNKISHRGKALQKMVQELKQRD